MQKGLVGTVDGLGCSQWLILPVRSGVADVRGSRAGGILTQKRTVLFSKSCRNLVFFCGF